MLSSLTSRFAAIVIALLLGACSTYGWADGDSDADMEALDSVHVQSISAPAHVGLDTSSLRAQLVDELERQSLSIDATRRGYSLQCTLRDEQTRGLGLYAVARIALSCDILHHRSDAAVTRLESIALATDSLAAYGELSEAAMTASRRAPTQAASDAILRLAPKIADELRHHHQSSFSDE